MKIEVYNSILRFIINFLIYFLSITVVVGTIYSMMGEDYHFSDTLEIHPRVLIRVAFAIYFTIRRPIIKEPKVKE